MTSRGGWVQMRLRCYCTHYLNSVVVDYTFKPVDR